MLPVRRVVLFKHGVGYFERRGTVAGDRAVELAFRASEMNDVLKSLTVLDLGEGLVTSIGYESTKPVDKQLEDIAIRLPDDNVLTGLLSQIKGARVRLAVGSRELDGVVVGIETVTRRAEGETRWGHLLSVLVDGAALETYDLLEIRRLTFLDEALRKDLQHLLDTLISTKRKDLKRLTILARGEGERELVASYIVEAPVWKTSYRLLLDEDAPVVQGWALVDNTSDEDWQDVSLSLVAGLPVSFVHDLYSPRYKRRPVVEVREEQAYAPPLLEEALEAAEPLADYEAEVTRTGAAKAFGGPAPMAPAAPRSMLAVPARARSEAARRTVEVQTRTAEVGDLFEYAIDNPVTVRRGQSALVPILQRPFEGKRVAVYNPEVRDRKPMSAVLFANTTGMTLEGGPVTVFEAGAYVGEAMLETLKPGEKRLVPFSVELGCLVTVDGESEVQDVHRARIVGGTLVVYRYRVQRTIYLVKNKLERDLEVLLENRITPEQSLVDTARLEERTERFYRFRLATKRGETLRFVVSERGDVHESWSISGVDRSRVGLWAEQRFIDEATRKSLLELAAMNEKLGSLDYWIAERERHIADIFDNQQRLRANLEALGSSEDERSLRERYVASLGAEEDRLAGLRAEIDAWATERAEVQSQLKAAVAGLRFEARFEPKGD